MHRITTAITFVLLIFVSLRLDGGSLEDAAASLGDDRFPQREQAENTLKAAGPEALGLVEALVDSDDIEVAMRARRIRDWIVCGIDERIPAALASDLPGFSELPRERQDAVISELAALDPPHLSALANLHSRLFAMRLDEGERDRLLGAVASAIASASAPRTLAPFTPWPLDVRTRAMLINHAASRRTATDLKETYAAWREQQPEIRSLLDSRGVSVEVERLRAEWDKRGALAYIAEIKDKQAFRILVREFRDWMLGDPNLKPGDLGETEAIAYLELTFESESPGDGIPLFRKLRDRIPGLEEKLRPSRESLLHALRLWDTGEHADAADLLCGKGRSVRSGTEFLARMILDTERIDFPTVMEQVSSQRVEKLMDLALRKPVSDLALGHAIGLSSCLRERGAYRNSKVFSCKSAERLALEFWQNGRDDFCHRVMEEAFWSAAGKDEWRLSLFPALSRAMGRLEDALAISTTISAETKQRDIKMAYLYRAAGRTAEALVHSARAPESSVHQLLLIESRNWAALAESGDDQTHVADWFACLNGDREEWRGDVPEPEEKSAYLRLMLDDSPAERAASAKSGRVKGKILRPDIGALSDPRAEEFVVLDGLIRARDLWNGGDRKAAKKQNLESVIRIILEAELREIGTTQSVGTLGVYSSGSSQLGEVMIRGYRGGDIPAEIGLSATRVVSLLSFDPSRSRISEDIAKDILRATAQVFARHGDYEQACRSYHRFCVLGLDAKFHPDNIGETAYLAELEIQRAKATGAHVKADKIFRHHLQDQE